MRISDWSSDVCSSDLLEDTCRRLEVPCIAVLDPVLSALGAHLGIKSHGRPGRQHELDAAYFRRIEAMDFTLANDDGQLVHDLEEADIVVVGVSRRSEEHTSELQSLMRISYAAFC